QRERADLEGTAGERAPGLSTKHDGAEPARGGASAHLVLLDQFLRRVHQLLRRLAGRSREDVAKLARRACRVVDALCAFLYAGRRLTEDLAENIEEATLAARL